VRKASLVNKLPVRSVILTRLSAIPFDGFLLALAATVGLAILMPPQGAAAAQVSIVAKVTVALLFFLYGARLSPQQAWHGLRQWRLHLLMLGSTFLIFPMFGLAAGALVPVVLTPEIYHGLLFLCLVPSTAQSSIVFTSIARGHVSAAMVGASLSNMLGVVLTPLLVTLLMNASGAPGVGGSALLGVVLQIVLPFAAGQLARPWIGELVTKRASLLKVVDRGATLLLAYAAFSRGMANGMSTGLDAWRWVSVFIVAAVLLAAVLVCTRLIGRLARLDRGDAVALLFCGSKKSLASGLPMALLLFPADTLGSTLLPLMIFYPMQLAVCGALARRFARDRAELVSASTSSAPSIQHQRWRSSRSQVHLPPRTRIALSSAAFSR
jgi:solute carrier family 10 (sodium/bile acid cotransporter), member 7